MRVAFDEQIFAIQPYGGISRLFTELARAFTSDSGHQVDLLPLGAPIVNRYVLDDQPLAQALSVRQAHNQWTALAWYFSHVQRGRAADLVHNTFYLPHGLASPKGAKRVVTVYDMIPERLPKTRRRLDFLTLKKRYVQSADHVICISEATRQDMESLYGPLHCPVSVVHLGVDPRFHPHAPRNPALPPHYVLMVGHRGQYKDARVLFAGFAAIADDFPELSLACVGGGALTREERAALSELGIHDRVVQMDLSDEVMPQAYAHAEVFVFPSRFEGFGLPVLEAMACGAPALLANSTSLPEVGGDAAHYFEPGNSQDLARKLAHLLEDTRVQLELGTAGKERAAKFTWKHTAAQTAAVYAQTLNVS